jgi:hypothetical protein
MKLWKTILLIIALVSFSCAIYLWLQEYSKTQTEIEFLSEEETQTILNNDADHYYSRFQKNDLKARGVKSKKDYLAKIANSACDGDPEIEEKIDFCIGRLKQRFTKLKQETIEGVSIDKLSALPWKIGFTSDKSYENGLPHTRGDTILLNVRTVKTKTIDDLCRLLLHEQTHVYQKQIDLGSYLKEEYDNMSISKEELAKIPANPDTDLNTYRHKKTGEVFMAQYNDSPKYFRDVVFKSGKDDVTKEHPYEYMAYKMEEIF